MGARSSTYAKVLAALLAAGALVAGGTASYAAVSVAVDGAPLTMTPGPIERGGRVYVPLRGIFERLGAAVVYNQGQINATKGNTTVALEIGSTRATVNGQQQFLDAAPFIVGSTTYVPLRFVSQSLGAVVGYDGASRSVSIDLAREPARPVVPVRPVVPPAPVPPRVSVTHLRAEQPASGAVVTERQPQISAEFTHRVEAGSLAVTLDGGDVTGWTQRNASGFYFTPRGHLYIGSHTVRVTGRDATGAYFDRSWNFRTAAPAPPPVSNLQLHEQQPSPGAQVANRTPRISAKFSRNVNAGTVTVHIDSTNVTGWTERNAWGFAITPRSPLDSGSHTVRVSGTDGAGLRFERQWSFAALAAPTPAPPTSAPPAPLKPHLNLSAPAANAVVALTFDVKGNTVANGRVKVAVGAQPGGGGNFTGITVAGPYGNFTVNVVLKLAPGQQTATVTVTATNPVNSQSTEKRLTVRLMQPN